MASNIASQIMWAYALFQMASNIASETLSGADGFKHIASKIMRAYALFQVAPNIAN